MKHNQFYRETRLTCPLYRPKEDICIGIYVFKRVFNVWHRLKRSVSMQQHFEHFRETKKTGRKVFGYFWSWTTKVWLCKPIFLTRTVKGTVQFDLWILDISNFVLSGKTLMTWYGKIHVRVVKRKPTLHCLAWYRSSFHTIYLGWDTNMMTMKS